MLHLLFKSPLAEAVIERIASGDDVVLMDAAVCAALSGHQDNLLLQRLLVAGCRVYALQEMLLVQGIELESVLPGVESVDYGGLVELTVANAAIHSWI